ncbi:hypothetical protein R1flu_000742 [Riccia fluitans]|uniref:Uncharacterized protein n=1 Tax=Riccia fluitans TaxID=41844 RepID=A0ABD1Y4F9_9MARC
MRGQLMQILAKATKLENHTRPSYTKLVLEICSEIHTNKKQIKKYKEEVKNLSTLIKESFQSLSRAVEVQKAKERWIAKLVHEIAKTAIRQVRKDGGQSEGGKLQTTQEPSRPHQRSRSKKFEEVTTSLQAAQGELCEARETTTRSQASEASLLLEGVVSTRKLQTAMADSADLRGALRASQEAV